MLIRIADLKVMLLFAAKKDIRFYLNGVCISGDKMIATDGRRLTVCQLDGDSGLNVVVPREEIEAAVALAKNKNKKLDVLDVTADRIGDVHYDPLPGKFPNWRNVIPEKISKMNVDGVSFNPGYLYDYKRMAAILKLKRPQITVWHEQNESVAVVSVYGAINYFCILMPIIGIEIPVIPNWLDKKKT